MARIIVGLNPVRVVTEASSHVGGQISFARLVDQLRKAGEFANNETVTDLIIDVERGMIEYRVRVA